MSDDDLIRRGDAIAACRYDDAHDCRDAIAAIHAVPVANRDSIERAVHDWIRDDAGMAVKMGITPDHVRALVSRILALLKP